MRGWLWAGCVVLVLGSSCGPRSSTPPRGGSAAAPSLPSWNEGPAKAAIQRFVANVTTLGDPGYVPTAERIAVFDNDGTLWAEQPVYFQVQFALDRVKALAPQHPEWRTKEPFNHLLAGDMKAFLAGGEHAVLAVVAAAHSGLTTDEFAAGRHDWLRTARHPKTGRPYTSMVYQPMLELLDYLRANGFKTFIVSGGGVEFMRAFADSVYGIPPEQVIGSQGKLRYEMRDGKPVLFKLPEVQFVDDGPGKPLGSRTSSAGVRSQRSATPTVTGRCSSGRGRGPGHGSRCSSTTRTPTASGPTTGTPPSAGSTRRLMRRSPQVGPWWT
jgi:phosphoglycolate phosphatase-like HAD superfamily hydrolase